MAIYRIRVYDSDDNVIDSWLVELPQGATGNGIMREVEREYPAHDWSMTETNEHIN